MYTWKELVLSARIHAILTMICSKDDFESALVHSISWSAQYDVFVEEEGLVLSLRIHVMLSLISPMETV